MKKIAAVWDGLCWFLSVVIPGAVHRVVPHPYSMGVCAAVLILNIAYMVFARPLKYDKTERSQLATVLETIFYVLAPIAGIVLAVMYDVYDKNPLII
ncbi:MAG: hypothetical protein IKJ69_02540 [Clostridia bacterium]|nr:hypothetical protein [Clostridia bacterium]